MSKPFGPFRRGKSPAFRSAYQVVHRPRDSLGTSVSSLHLSKSNWAFVDAVETGSGCLRDSECMNSSRGGIRFRRKFRLWKVYQNRLVTPSSQFPPPQSLFQDFTLGHLCIGLFDRLSSTPSGRPLEKCRTRFMNPLADTALRKVPSLLEPFLSVIG
jgi:hypothetical protein